MTKKRVKASKSAPPSGPISRKVSNELVQIQKLVDEGRAGEALQAIARLAQRYPRDPDVFSLLFNAAAQASDDRSLLLAAERLVQLNPDDPTLLFNLAAAYLANEFAALALETHQKFLARWPGHSRSAEIRRTVAELEVALSPQTERDEIPSGRGVEIALLHERSQAALAQHRFSEARRLAESAIAEAPRFIAPLNNISLAYFLDGDTANAIAAARRVLAAEPDNFHALANLVHFLLLQGEPAEARAMADRLLAVQSDRPDIRVKKAEALSFLGDDVGVQTAFRAAQSVLKEGAMHPLLPHYAAVAEAHLGNEAEARRLWEAVLKRAPGLMPAQANLDDLRRPVSERSGVWAITLNNWLPEAFVRDLARIATDAERGRSSTSVERATRQFLAQHPQILVLAPILLARGDPGGRELALLLARTMRTPELLAALKEFIVGLAGTDQQRLQAAQVLADEGILPRGEMERLWLGGQFEATMLLSYEITTQPEPPLPGPLQHRFEKAVLLLHDGRPDEAEPLLRALAVELPDRPMILNNIANAHMQRGEKEAAEAIIRSIAERFPDYMFARCNMATIAVEHRDFDAAEEWLAPLRSRAKFHFSEFRALAGAHVNLEHARGRMESARSWLEMWAAADPDAPNLDYWRELLHSPAVSPRARGAVHRPRRH
jgi:tetratricopeptide (TPR) repeat protein